MKSFKRGMIAVSNYDYTADIKKGKIDRSNFDANIQFLDKTMLLKKDIMILEIGCGAGRLTNHLTNKGFNVVGFDISRTLIKEGNRRYSDAKTFIASGETNMPFKDSFFDIVLSFDVLEHIPKTDKHLLEIKRILKPDGYYLLQTPNKFTNILFEVIKNRSFTEHRKYHCSLHSYWQLKKRFQNNGFNIIFCNVPVVNDFIESKIVEQFGFIGEVALKILNFDHLPYFLKTNFYLKVWKCGEI